MKSLKRANGAGRPHSPVRWAVAVFVIVLAGFAVAAVGYVVSSRSRDAALLATRARTVSVTVDAMVRDAGDQANAVAAFFRGSHDVSDAEFTGFVNDIGLTEGMFGIGFVTVVDGSDLAAFETTLRQDHPEAFVFEVDGIEQIPVGPREFYYPIRFFYSAEELPAWGFDAATNADFAAAVDRILEFGEPTASGFLAFPGRPGVDGWVMFAPAFGPDGSLQGVVATAMDLGDVLDAAAPIGVEADVDLRIVDLNGEAPPPPDGARTETIAASDRLFRLDMTPGPSNSYFWAGFTLFGFGAVVAAALAAAVLAVSARLRQKREVEEMHSLDRQKDDFLATVSHELRTPLTSIVGFADALRMGSGELSRADQVEMIGFIADEADAMEGIVQDLLVVARLHQGGAVPISLRIVDDLATEVKRIADQAAIVRSSPTTVSGNTAVFADPARLRQILRNLFDNAVRHGLPPIEVTIEADGEQARVRVQDSGPGVEAAEVPQLFDRYRSGPNPEGLPTSTGIGLWLSRELARLMGGDLRLLPSETGALFELRLPVAVGEEYTVETTSQAVGF